MHRDMNATAAATAVVPGEEQEEPEEVVLPADIGLSDDDDDDAGPASYPVKFLWNAATAQLTEVPVDAPFDASVCSGDGRGDGEAGM